MMGKLKQKGGIEGQLPCINSQRVFKGIVKVLRQTFHPQIGADKRRFDKSQMALPPLREAR